MKNLITLLLILLVTGCGTLLPSTKATNQVTSSNSIYFTVFEDCVGTECTYTAVDLVDKHGIVMNMELTPFTKVGIKKTEIPGEWTFVRESSEAERFINLSDIRIKIRPQNL